MLTKNILCGCILSELSCKVFFRKLVEKTINKMRNKYLWIIPILSALCSPMIATEAEFVECEDLYPDEFLDLFGISENSVMVSGMSRFHPSVFSFFYSQPKAHAFQCHMEYPYLQPVASDLVLSVSLRC